MQCKAKLNSIGARGLHAVHNSARTGTLVGSYTIRYADGTNLPVSLAYGRDLSDWWFGSDSGEPTRALPAWSGDNTVARASGRRIRLYQTVWTNPHPDKAVVAIDFASANGTTTPFCVAMTIEK